MRFRPLSTLVFVASTAAIAASCATGDSPTSPPDAKQSVVKPSPEPSKSLLGGLLGTSQTVVGLQRTTPLTSAITVTKSIGVLGGTLSIPAAGLTVIVPPLALTSTKTISITAVAGSTVAYEFSPAGTKFLLPLVATQSLVNTQAHNGGLINPLSLFVGYFANNGNINLVSEILNINLNILGQLAVFDIWHFSGYILASGYDSGI